MSMLLRDEGFTVRTAANGIEALARLDEMAADLMLVDLMMPGMDGRAFLIEARAAGYRAPTMIVSASPEAVQVAAELGCAGLVPKPYDFNQLVKEMRRVLERVPQAV
jgi:CheY-like chemotaxis protein